MNKKHLILAVLAVLLVSTAAYAYVLLSPTRTWSSTPTYIVDNRGQSSITDGDGGATRTRNAITSSSAWNGAGAGTVINATIGSVSSWSLGDGTPMLNFRDPTGACSGSCLAACFTGYYSGGTIYDADIITNTSHSWTSVGESGGCSGEFYIEGVMVHEIGHGLGIGHSNVGGATMYPSVSSCNNSPATTESDDDAAINALYGGGPSGPTCAGSCGGNAGSCWCDAYCSYYGDCCPDKVAICGP